MTVPTLTVALARASGWVLGEGILGTDTFLGGFTFEDLPAAAVRSVTISRGRSHELNRVEAGRANIRLANRTGDFDPTNEASPYAPDIRPMIPVRIQATYSAVTYDLFSGFIEGWPQQWTRGPSGDAWVDVTAVDAFKVLNLAEVTITRGVEDTGSRIGAVLDAIGWSATDRAIDTGESTVQAATLTGANALTHIQDVATSEGGLFFMSGDGQATFYNRTHYLTLDEDDTWGDAGAELDYDELTYTYEDANLWNEVTVTANALTDQTVTDDASVLLYYPRALTVATLLTTTAAMLERAEDLLARYSTPELRVSQVSPEPRGAEALQWPRILGKDIHSRVVVRKRPPSGGLIDQPSFIEGVTYTVNYQRQQFDVEWRLSSTLPQVGQWVLGDATLGVLGSTTSLVSAIT
jgi:hypothetical protein